MALYTTGGRVRELLNKKGLSMLNVSKKAALQDLVMINHFFFGYNGESYSGRCLTSSQ